MSLEQLYPDDFRNDSGEEVPAFGIIQVSNSAKVDRMKLLLGTKFGGGAGTTYINGPMKVPAGRFGKCSRVNGVYAKFDQSGGGPPAAGEVWGPVLGSWDIQRTGSGYLILGHIEGSTVRVQPIAAQADVKPNKIPFVLGENKLRNNNGPVDAWLTDYAGNQLQQVEVMDTLGLFGGVSGQRGFVTLIRSANALEPDRREIESINTYCPFVIATPEAPGVVHATAFATVNAAIPGPEGNVVPESNRVLLVDPDGAYYESHEQSVKETPYYCRLVEPFDPSGYPKYMPICHMPDFLGLTYGITTASGSGASKSGVDDVQIGFQNIEVYDPKEAPNANIFETVGATTDVEIWDKGDDTDPGTAGKMVIAIMTREGEVAVYYSCKKSPLEEEGQ